MRGRPSLRAMKRKKQQAYWAKRSEYFVTSSLAHQRAGVLRLHDSVRHVQVRHEGGRYAVSYAVAQWYLKELASAGLEL